MAAVVLWNVVLKVLIQANIDNQSSTSFEEFENQCQKNIVMP